MNIVAPAEVADGAAKGLHALETGVRFSTFMDTPMMKGETVAANQSKMYMGSADAALVRWGAPNPFPSPMLTPVDVTPPANI